MKKILYISVVALLAPILAAAQVEPHYTMFMFNSLVFNPAYAGSRGVTSLNLDGREQWTDIDGAPTTGTISIDGPVHLKNKDWAPLYPWSVGLCISGEQIGVEKNMYFLTDFAFRIRTGEKTVLSLGIDAGVKYYKADYNALDLYQANDPNLVPFNYKMLPDAGAGIYWTYADKFYAGFSIPNLMENFYNLNDMTINSLNPMGISGYYLNTGYVITFKNGDEIGVIKLKPQVLARYVSFSGYQLPLSCDFNLSAIYKDWLMFGVTYRTDQSVEGVLEMQVLRTLRIGFAYDYYNTTSLNPYTGGTYEITIGHDFIRNSPDYVSPRFIKSF